MINCNVTPLLLEGTAYEQGLKEGRALAKEIQKNVDVAITLTKKVRESKEYQTFLEDNYNYLIKTFPEMEAEMKGISEGSGIPLASIKELNIPAYFLTGNFPQECSMILARGEATEDGKTYVIKNRDMRASISQVLVRRVYPDGLVISEVKGIGTVTYPASGLNSFGLGITTTGFWSSKVVPDMEMAKESQVFLNIHQLLRDCKSVDEAVNHIQSISVMNGLNIILVDREKACIVEMTKDDIHIEWDLGSGLLFRSNHYVSPSLTALNPEASEYPSTFLRYDRMEQLLKEYKGHIRFQDLLRILADHKNGINGLCRHPEGAVVSQTVSTTILILEDGEIWTTLQNPCQALPHCSIFE